MCTTLQGIKFLQSHSIIGESAADVAEYLMKGELLNKRAIGDYLGEKWVWLLMVFHVESHGAVMWGEEDHMRVTWGHMTVTWGGNMSVTWGHMTVTCG